MRQSQVALQVAGRPACRAGRRGFDGALTPRRLRELHRGTRQGIELLETRLLLADTTALKETTLDGHAQANSDQALTAAAAPDRFEPNNSFATATNLGALGYRVETGLSIAPINDEDYFQFTAGVSGTFNIDLSFTNSLGDIDLYVYDSSLTQIGKSISSKDTEHVGLSLSAGDSCFIKVLGYDGATNPNYSLTILGYSSGPDRFEPNDNFIQATDFGTLGSRTESGLSIHAANNSDYYRFTAATSGLLNVNLLFTHSMGDLDLYLYNSSALQIASSDGASNNEHIAYNVVAGSSYYVGVEGFSGATNPFYTLQLIATLPAWLADDGGVAYSFSGPTSAPLLTIAAGQGRLVADAGAAMPGLSVTVNPQASLLTDTDQTLAGLGIGDGGAFAVTPGASRLLRVDSLSLAPTGHIDLAASDLVLTHATPAAFDAIRQDVFAGHIATSVPQPAAGHFATLVPVDNRLLQLTSWSGRPIAGGTDFSQVIVKYAWIGDTNLDGQVTEADYASVIANQGKSAQWISGDLNGDGLATPDDLAVVSANLGAGSSGFSGPPLPEQDPSSAMVTTLTRRVPAQPAAKSVTIFPEIAGNARSVLGTPSPSSALSRQTTESPGFLVTPAATRPRTISGVAFDDANGDGIRQPAEKLRHSAVVFIDTNSNGRLDAGEPKTRSDATGRYVFSDVAIAAYQLHGGQFTTAITKKVRSIRAGKA